MVPSLALIRTCDISLPSESLTVLHPLCLRFWVAFLTLPEVQRYPACGLTGMPTVSPLPSYRDVSPVIALPGTLMFRWPVEWVWPHTQIQT